MIDLLLRRLFKSILFFFAESSPGWNVDLIYKTNSGIDFSEFFAHVKNDTAPHASTNSTEGSFVNLSLHDNLFLAQEIMIVVVDERGKVREELKFRGVHDIWNWFSPQNIIASSLWDLDASSALDVFEFGYNSEGNFNFEIGASTQNCVSSGFFKISCDVTEPCRHFRWWSFNHGLKTKPCGFLYSRLREPTDYGNAFWASEIKILTKTAGSVKPSDLWQKVFMMKSFAGVHAYYYFATGEQKNPDENGDFFPQKTYRHVNLVEKIKTAELIRFQVFNVNETVVVSELVFNGTGDRDSWFALENLHRSSLWNFSSWSNKSYGAFFSLYPKEYQRLFFIHNQNGSCNTDNGWFVIIAKTTSSPGGCSWERWWTKSQVRLLIQNSKHQPSYILYTPGQHAGFANDYLMGGKIEISVN